MLSKFSIELTKSFDKEEIKAFGIYFTPKPIIDQTLEQVQAIALRTGLNITEILEPSCGACDFALETLTRFPAARLDAVELHDTIYERIAPFQNSSLRLYHADFLHWMPPQREKKYDLIVGNPPYFVMKKPDVPRNYYPFFEGRPNIYVIFLLKAWTLLAENGLLALVIPQNFLNCHYYAKTREHLLANGLIQAIFLCGEGGFLDTQQPTIILVVQKAPSAMSIEERRQRNEPFALYHAGPARSVIFNTPENIVRLKHLYRDASTLEEMGVSVSVGTVVWNQCKDILSNNPTDTLLIYSSNLVHGECVVQEYKNEEKKNYIQKEGWLGPLLVINRGYGKGTYTMEHCLLQLDRPYLIENHLICLRADGVEDPAIAVGIYQSIQQSLRDPRTLEFIALYFGNNAINCNELRHFLPIYL